MDRREQTSECNRNGGQSEILARISNARPRNVQVPAAARIDVYRESPTRTLYAWANGGYAPLHAVLCVNRGLQRETERQRLRGQTGDQGT